MDSKQLRSLLKKAVPGDIDSPGLDPGESIGRPMALPGAREGAASSGDDSAVPRVDAPLEMLEEIARGGMGIVFRARQASLRREVAVKKLKKSGAEGAFDSFLAEAIITALLEHPNVVPVHDLVESPDGSIALAMKRVEGTSWRDLLHPSTQAAKLVAKRFTLERHLEVLLDVCDAVAFAHSRGIVHCDLKPSNVMVGDYGEVLVMDWGMALAFDPERVPAGCRPYVPRTRDLELPRGTPGYLAPEMARAKVDQLGPPTDVYLLGGILYEILTRLQPHRGDSVYDVIKSAAQGKLPELGPEVPEELRAICLKALAKRQEQRFQGAIELQTAIREYLTHRESLLITHEADARVAEFQERSDRARVGRRGYTVLGEAIAAYRQALLLWPENVTAGEGEIIARELQARAAIEAEDFELARSQVEGLETETARQLAAMAREGMAHRQQARRSLRRLRVGAIVAAAVIIVGLSVGMVLVSQERDRADESAITAQAMAEKAEGHRREAVLNLGAALDNERKAKEYAQKVEEEAKARVAALEAKDLEAARADRFAAKAERSEEEAERSAAEAARQGERADDSLDLARRKAAEAEEAARQARAAERRARQSAERARAEAADKERMLGEVHRLADLLLLEGLDERAKALLTDPARNLVPLEQWLRAAEAVAERLPDHETALLEVQRKAAAGSKKAMEGLDRIAPMVARSRELELTARQASGEARTRTLRELTALEERLRRLRAQVQAAPDLRFETDDARWRCEILARLVDELRVFADPAKGPLAKAREAVELAVSGDRYAVERYSREWSRAIRAITRSARYGGLRLRPQRGLVPLGRDPHSNLQEFLHLATHRGPIPERDSKGAITLSEDTGLILVLVPGGSFEMGRQPKNRVVGDSARLRDSEGPRHDVELAPFFLSKYEMTQAQWLRLEGSNPSFCKPPERYGETTLSLLHPVELVSWEDCQALRRVGLVLPTEAQWEYAARGGTGELWWCGNDVDDLARAANLGDRSHTEHGAEPRAPKVEEWEDGWPMHARVGTFPPNPFGLHDVIGNVREWCQDPFGGYDLPLSAEDGFRQVKDARNRVMRGGSFRDQAIYARMAARRGARPQERASAVGLRPARRLVTEEVTEDSWESVQRRMARNPRYRGAKTEARSDLSPLGPDPTSGLEEFLHRKTHEGPALTRDAEGRLLTSEQTGLIFVLLPGGSFTMGSQGADPKGSNYDRAAPEDAPVHEVNLAPFFISKYEMTQAQWLRLSGANPSEFGPDANYNLHQHTLRHPVESVSWEDCSALARLGMALPTEAQWEYAARGGGPSVYGSFGDDPVLLAPVANLADAQYNRMYRQRAAESWDDGYIMHAPVGLYLPNGYGLHDVLGNVAEWCRDGLVRYDVTPAPRTGERAAPEAPLRAHRGGSYQSRAPDARTALRSGAIPTTRTSALGVRPVIE